jgi:hypothetical protein
VGDEPQQLADEFHKWAKWIRQKESGNPWYGYRLNVDASEAEERLPELRSFVAALRYFCIDRTGPPSITPSHFDGYIADLDRAAQFRRYRILRDENGAEVPDKDGNPKVVQVLFTEERLEFLNKRLPESMLTAIEASEISVRKWAFRSCSSGNGTETDRSSVDAKLSGRPADGESTEQKPAPERVQKATPPIVNRLDLDFQLKYDESEKRGTIERNGKKVDLPKVLKDVFTLLRQNYPTTLAAETIAERLRGQFDSHIPGVVKRLRNELAEIGLTISKAPYVVREKKI